MGISAVPSMAMNSRTAMRKESPTAPAATVASTLLGSRLPKTPLIAAPSRGKTGMSQRILNESIVISRGAMPSSPLQQIAAIHIERLAISKHCNHQRETYRGFRGSDNQNEKNENLTTDLSVLAGERHKSQVDGIQHDFNRQKQRDDVAFDKEPQHADQKQNCSNNEIPTDGDHKSFLANTTAPTRAISINNDVASN